MERIPSVAEWMEGKDILITGATGFMGKVLVEKLLRCCPNLNRLYLVVRNKRGFDPEERIKEFTRNALFSVLLEKNPNAFDKLTVISGDMSELGCGISEKNLKMLQENISIVFHIAATVRFNHPLSVALKMNTRGTYELIKIAKQMKKLEVFEYVSTTYSNANLDGRIEEKVYPSHLDWKVLLRLVDTDGDVLDLLLHKLIWTQPNTYTLSKSLAENIIQEASKEIPAVIIRPSVVISSLYEPIPGWTDNLNGFVGVTTGCTKGVIRVFKACPTAALDFVPVDVSINGLVAAAWSKRFFNNINGDLQVFNQAYAERYPVTFSEILNLGLKVADEIPTDNRSWYPFLILTNNTYYYHFLFFFLQLIPAILQDLILSLLGREPLVVRLNIKIYNAAIALSDFSEKVFKFANDKYRSIQKRLSPDDQKTYRTNEEEMKIDRYRYVFSFQKGVKEYIFNEKEEDLPRLRRNHRRLYYIDRATRALIVGSILWKLVCTISPYL
uniref:Fatty acyl-CoA reductase n=1 Tax=Lygus hesperus TaxID=30085 RepID=A0A0A9YXW9_LYGHE